MIRFPSFDVGTDGEKKTVTIMDFYRERYGRELVHLDLPCFIIGPVEKNNFVPMEVSENQPTIFLTVVSLHPWPVGLCSFIGRVIVVRDQRRAEEVGQAGGQAE